MSKCCEKEGHVQSVTADFSLSRLIKEYLDEIFRSRNVSEENRKKLWEYYYNKFSGGLEIGFTYDDQELLKELKMSLAEFSAFKEASFKNLLQNSLIKEDRLISWQEFKKLAYQIDAEYNFRYLEVEYNQTIANAQSAAKWKDFEETKDLYPNLKFLTVGDGRVRPEHEILNGIIKPIDDPFWSSYYPPLDWGCRCSVMQTDEEPEGELKGGFQTKIEFENNPAKTGKIFGETSYKNNLTDAEIILTEERLNKWLEE